MDLTKARKEQRVRVDHNLSRIRQRKASRLSSGEKLVAEYLMKNSIHFEREWFFNELFTRDRGRLLYFDFWLPDHRICIEFDGEQHYTLEFRGKKLSNLRKNDFLKTAFCKKNGFKLLRIKFDCQDVEMEICKFFDKHVF